MDTETKTKTETKTGKFPCPQCDRDDFRSPAARAMHIGRVHTKRIKTPGQKGGKRTKMSHEEHLRRRRIYNRKWRLDHGMKARPGLYKKRGQQFGSKWTPARRKKFDATWKAKKNSSVEKNNHLQDPRGYINCCPNCGEDLVAFYLAKGAMQRRKEVKV